MKSNVSLSADTKDALARDMPASEHCRAALRSALALYGSVESNGTRLFRTRRNAIARLFRSLSEGPGPAAIRKTATPRLYRTPVYEIALAPGEDEPPRPAARCDRRMEVRGAFLACGSLAAPGHGYHLEFVPPPERVARLAALLRSTVAAPKSASRKNRPVLYFKDIDAITACLTTIGAFGAVLHLEDVRAMKETKNRIHRLVNSEAANVDRAASAAAHHREAIAYLADAYGLRNLSPVLREAAELRLAYPDETLAEIGKRCRPPASKSTMSGRIMSLMRMVRRLRASPAASAGGSELTPGERWSDSSTG